MQELKPCPFCGKEVKHFESTYHQHCVRCINCGIGTDFSDKAEVVIDKWNRRAETRPKMFWRDEEITE